METKDALQCHSQQGRAWWKHLLPSFGVNATTPAAQGVPLCRQGASYGSWAQLRCILPLMLAVHRSPTSAHRYNEGGKSKFQQTERQPNRSICISKRPVLASYSFIILFQDAVSAATDEERLVKIHDVIQQLPPPHYRLVCVVLPCHTLFATLTAHQDPGFPSAACLG